MTRKTLRNTHGLSKEWELDEISWASWGEEGGEWEGMRDENMREWYGQGERDRVGEQ